MGRLGGVVEVVVTGAWVPEAGDVFRSGRADRLVLNYALGFNEPTLEFLRDLPIRQLVILDRRLTDLEPIYSLAPTLERLDLTTNPSLTVDLSRFPGLAEVGADWAQVKDSIAAAVNLRRIFLMHYGHADLSPLLPLRSLADITMKDRPRLRSLAGLSELREIRTLGIYLAKDLEDVSDLRSRAEIEEVELEACRKLTDVEDLVGCAGLRMLNLSECGSIASVGPLGALTRLEYLYLFGSTNVVDGDLTPIVGLPRLKELRMQSRRHYRPSVEEIEGSLPKG